MPTASGSASGSPPADIDSNKRKGKKRIRAFTAEERASHRVIEKQRREALNESFLDLARLIPALASVRRLSKSVIVQESMQHLQAQREMCLAAAGQIQAVLTENIELIAEINSWREQYGAGMGSRQVQPVGDAVLALLKVDQEVFGTFPGGFGDNGNGEEHDDEHVIERPQIDERRDSIQSVFPPQPAPPASAVPDYDSAEYNSVDPQPVSQSFHLDFNHIMGMPNNFTDVNGISTRQTMLPDEDPFPFLDDGYDIHLASNYPPISSNFANLNMHRDVFHDFTTPTPEMGRYLVPTPDEPNLGYTL